MSDEQQAHDVIKTITRKVGGEDARRTMQRIFQDIQRLYQQAGPDGIVTVTVTAHVPSRRLPP